VQKVATSAKASEKERHFNVFINHEAIFLRIFNALEVKKCFS
jgi:hypothetical protein